MPPVDGGFQNKTPKLWRLRSRRTAPANRSFFVIARTCAGRDPAIRRECFKASWISALARSDEGGTDVEEDRHAGGSCRDVGLPRVGRRARTGAIGRRMPA